MKKPKAPTVSPRKLPSQARSAQMVADILEAALRVLAREGARRFTTVRVAEEAGVSVGSLYQYFPNKEALLYRLQTDEWQQTGSALDALLGDTRRPPLARLRTVVRAFFRSECDEAELRVALGDAASLYRHAPETHQHRRVVVERFARFVAEALPHVPARERAVAAELVMTSMSAIGKSVSEAGRSRRWVDARADAASDMFVAYLESLSRAHRAVSAASGGTRRASARSTA